MTLAYITCTRIDKTFLLGLGRFSPTFEYRYNNVLRLRVRDLGLGVTWDWGRMIMELGLGF